MRLSTSYLNQIGISRMLEQQTQIGNLQQQISSGKRLVSSVDDPSGAAQLLRINEEISVNNQYQRNSDIIKNRLSLEETALETIENSLIRAKELAVQGSNSTVSSADRQSIITEVRERLDEVLGLANTRDSNREYLFSGYQSLTQPFIRNANGTYSYNGDQGNRELQISSGRTMADSHHGLEVFGNIFNGNGTFQVADTTTNAGTGVISVGQVTDSSAYVEDTYTITFVTNSSGNLAYNVIGATSGQIIPALPQNATNDAPDYVSGTAINFNGIETSISELPVAGDTFTVSPSQRQDIFTTLENLATALAADDVQRNNQVARSIQDIDQAFENILRMRTDIGARLKTIDDQIDTNVEFIADMEVTRSRIEDLNVFEAISELTSRLATLQAAQATYTRVQGLSLFNQI